MKKHYIFSLFILLILFLSIGSISAADDFSVDSSNNEIDLNQAWDDSISKANNEILSDSSGNIHGSDSDSSVEDFTDSDSSGNIHGSDSDSSVEDSADSDSSVEDSTDSAIDNSNRTFDEIQSLIDSASAGDTILLNGTYTSSGNPITLNKSLTIEGQGLTVLNANKLSEILKIKSDSFTLRNIVFLNYNGTASAISISGGKLGLIENCSFINNSGVHYGSSIYAPSIDSLSISNCDFNNNFAYYGAAIFANCTVSDSCFVDNKAIYYGGAIYGNANVSGSTFINNSGMGGGAIFTWEEINVANSAFINNSADDGGAIWGTGTVENSNFIHNSAVSEYVGSAGAVCGNIMAIGCNFTDNYAVGRGGAMDNGFAQNCIFINNSAYMGGAMFSWNGNIAKNCSFINNSASGSGGATYQITVISSLFSGNHANGSGGAMYYSLVADSIFKENSAQSSGGACYNLTVSNCLFENNSGQYGGAVANSLVANSIFNDNSARAYGGAISNSNVSVDCQFSNNTAPEGSDTYGVEWFNQSHGKTIADLNELINNNSDSEVYLDGNYSFYFGSDISFMDGIVIDRPLTIYGNGFAIDGGNYSRIFFVDCSDVVFRDLIIKNANTTGFGSAIRGLSTAINCTFINNYNYAVYNVNLINSSLINNTKGGAYVEFIDSYSVIGSKFINNSAFDYYGNLYIRGVNSSSIIGSSFINNTALDGGALYLEDVRNSTVENSAFAGNLAYFYKGGAIYDASIDSKILNCTFRENLASNIYEYEWHYGEGGAIYSAARNSLIENSSFVSNKALGYGGAIYSNSSSMAIKNSDFRNGSANYGGAVYGPCHIVNSRFTSNWAKYNGGAVYTNGKNCIIEGSNFTKNNASNKGGAVAYSLNSTGKISSSIFKENHAGADGGAIDWNLKAKNISSSKFINNTSPRENDISGLYTIKISKSGTYAGNLLITMRVYNAFTSKYAKKANIILTFTSSKGKQYNRTVTTNAKGLAKYYVALPAAKYTVRFNSNFDLGKKLTITVKSVKAKLTASKLTAKYKSSKKFNVNVRIYKKGKKLTNVKIALKVYTGKKAKTYYAYSKNGVAKFSVSSLSKGTHKVFVSSALSSVKASRIRSTIVIKK